MFRAARGKQYLNYLGKKMKYIELLIKTSGGYKEMAQNISNAERNYQSKSLYLAKISFRNEGVIKTFSNEEK